MSFHIDMHGQQRLFQHPERCFVNISKSHQLYQKQVSQSLDLKKVYQEMGTVILSDFWRERKPTSGKTLKKKICILRLPYFMDTFKLDVFPFEVLKQPFWSPRKLTSFLGSVVHIEKNRAKDSLAEIKCFTQRADTKSISLQRAFWHLKH